MQEKDNDKIDVEVIQAAQNQSPNGAEGIDNVCAQYRIRKLEVRARKVSELLDAVSDEIWGKSEGGCLDATSSPEKQALLQKRTSLNKELEELSRTANLMREAAKIAVTKQNEEYHQLERSQKMSDWQGS